MLLPLCLGTIGQTLNKLSDIGPVPGIEYLPLLFFYTCRGKLNIREHDTVSEQHIIDVAVINISTLFNGFNYAENTVLGLLERPPNFAVCVAVSVCEVPDSIFPLNRATFYLK